MAQEPREVITEVAIQGSSMIKFELEAMVAVIEASEIVILLHVLYLGIAGGFFIDTPFSGCPLFFASLNRFIHRDRIISKIFN